MRRLEGKTAIVTAAASGIGKATALRLAQEGARIACVDILDRVTEPVDQIRAEGGTAEAWVLDIMDRAAASDVFVEAERRLGPVDILVNGVGRSAAVTGGGEFWCSEPETWDEVIDLSLKATMYCTRLVVPGMRERRSGNVVNIASVSFLMPTPTFGDYAAAKAGVVGFTRVLAVELAPFNVRANAVSPGPIATDATARHPEETRRRVMASIPLGHYGEPADIAAGIAYLASDDAKFVTAQNLVIGGGRGIV